MARKRVIYQSEGLYVGPTSGATHNETLNSVAGGSITRTGVEPAQLHRIQSINYGFDIPRQDVNQFGQLARIDQVILEQPTVDLDFSWYTETGHNEQQLGFHMGGANALSHIIEGKLGTPDTAVHAGVPGSNFYVRVSAEGDDLNLTNNTQDKVIGMGNCFVTNLTAEASVGSFPTTSCTAEGLNMKFYAATEGTSTSAAVPAVNPVDGSSITAIYVLPHAKQGEQDMPTALRPGDIKFTADILTDNKLWRGMDADELKIQSFSISADMSRENLERLGSKFAYSKELEFPLTATLTMEAIVSDQVADDLENIINDDDSTYKARMQIFPPNYDGTKGNTQHAIAYALRGCKTDSLSFSSAIGDNKTVSLTATAQIGAKDDTANGFFMFTSGVSITTNE